MQFHHLGQALAAELGGERAHRMHSREVQAARAVHQHLDQPGFVQRRIGIRRTGQARHAARDCREHLGFERGLVLEARLAQARDQIHQARRHHETTGVDRLLRLESGRRLAERCDLAVDDEHVLHRIDAVARVYDTTSLDMNIHGASIRESSLRAQRSNLTSDRA